MLKTTCIRHPSKARYISLYEWQVDFCNGNHCSALLLSFFSNWHDWKLLNDDYYRQVNDIAEMHGEGRTSNQNAYLFFTTETLMAGCIHLYGKKAIVDSIDHLASLGVISVHKNPNPRYHFDKTRYFQFFPEICNQWLAENYSKLLAEPENIDLPKKHYATRQSALPTRENTPAITNNTNKNNNKLINEDDSILNKAKDCKTNVADDINELIDALIGVGMPENRLENEDDIETLKSILNTGASIELILNAYSDALRATKKRKASFGARYLEKVVISKLTTNRVNMSQNRNEKLDNSESHYKNDLENARSFAGDLL